MSVIKIGYLPKAVVISQGHEPVAQLDHHLELQLVVFRILVDGKVGVRNGSVPARRAKLVGVIEQMQLFYDVVHDEARVDPHLPRFRRTLLVNCVVLHRILTLVADSPIKVWAVSVLLVHDFDLLAAIVDDVSYIYALLGIHNEHLVDDVQQLVRIP